MTTIRIKRIYESSASTDGFRVLVDRVWPRGIKKADAHLDAWCRKIAPSSELRTWFGHDPSRFDEFAQRYRAELEESGAASELMTIIDSHPVVTLLYGAKDEHHNQAVVLREFLEHESFPKAI